MNDFQACESMNTLVFAGIGFDLKVSHCSSSYRFFVVSFCMDLVSSVIRSCTITLLFLILAQLPPISSSPSLSFKFRCLSLITFTQSSSERWPSPYLPHSCLSDCSLRIFTRLHRYQMSYASHLAGKLLFLRCSITFPLLI